jgi:hypothetical protein
MSIQGWYYLHTNGELIYKPDHGETAADIRDSDFALCMWAMDPTDRMGAWNICIEGLALGAKHGRVMELAAKWGLSDADADVYADRAGITIQMDGNAWCATGPGFDNLQESPAGFGPSKLEAMADLAKAMGVQAGKMWRTTFVDMLKSNKAAA